MPSLPLCLKTQKMGGNGNNRHNNGPIPMRDGRGLNIGERMKRLDIGRDRMKRTRPRRGRGQLYDNI